MAFDSIPNPAFDPANVDRQVQVKQNETKWNKTPPFELENVQIRAIDLMLKGLRDSEIVSKLKIGRSTLWRWKTRDRNFRECLASSREQLHAAAVDGFQTTLLCATSVLRDFLSGKVKTHRLRAAQIVLNMAGCFRAEKPQRPGLPLPWMEPKQG